MRIGLIVSMLIMLACQPGYDKISEEKMINILVDMHISDQIIRKYEFENHDSIRDLLSKSLLKVHSVTQQQLDTNLYLYQFDTEGYRELTEKVVKKLEELQPKGEDTK